MQYNISSNTSLSTSKGSASEWWHGDEEGLSDSSESGNGAGASAGASASTSSSRRWKRRAWLNYLHGLNLNQFDHDIAGAMKRNHKNHPKLARDYSIKELAQLQFCHEGLAQVFEINGMTQPPHYVIGNKGRFTTASSLINFLLDFGDAETRRGWAKLTYRLIYQKTCAAVERHLGQQWRWR